jgi:phosphatidylglycerophosphate synthase
MALRSKGFGDTTDYVMMGAVTLAAVLLADFPASWWLALAAGGSIVALCLWYRRKPRRSYITTKN